MANVSFKKYLEGKLKKNPNLNKVLDDSSRAIKIANQIYSLRKERGLTQEDLARAIGINQSNIARIEDADYSNYTLSTLTKVAAGLSADLNIFITSPDKTVSLVNTYLGFVPSSNYVLCGGNNSTNSFISHSEDRRNENKITLFMRNKDSDNFPGTARMYLV